MSTVTLPQSLPARRAYGQCATRFERLLLRTGAALEQAALRRIERRALHAARPYQAHDEARRDAAAAGHLGLMPR